MQLLKAVGAFLAILVVFHISIGLMGPPGAVLAAAALAGWWMFRGSGLTLRGALSSPSSTADSQQPEESQGPASSAPAAVEVAQLRREIEALHGMLMVHTVALKQLVKQFPELKDQLATFSLDPDVAFHGMNASEITKEEALAEAEILFR